MRYLSGGLLGDFIHQLSVINEIWLRTGKRGILFITDKVGDSFRRSLTETYSDIYPVIIAQEYIEDFQIHNCEQIDVNLSSWRQVNISISWHVIFGIYNIDWARTPFLRVDPNTTYSNIVLVSTTPTRWPSEINFISLFQKIGFQIMFICVEEPNYNDFVKRTNIQLPVVVCSTFKSLVTTIAGCRYLISTLSMPLSVADALHKKRVALFCRGRDDIISIGTNRSGIYVTDEFDNLQLPSV
jgi:hypothetical protein